jgi:hypothetical protein
MSAERCSHVAPSGHDCAGSQCGLHAGHRGEHTALVATEFLPGGNVATVDMDRTSPPSVRCRAGHRVYATQASTGKWYIPGICPACAGEADE